MAWLAQERLPSALAAPVSLYLDRKIKASHWRPPGPLPDVHLFLSAQVVPLPDPATPPPEPPGPAPKVH